MPIDPLDLTLDQYAAAVGKHRQALRPLYARLLRTGDGLDLPSPTRQTAAADGTIKFCLPAGLHNDKPLESESVIIPMTSYRGSTWYTLCVSSQVGCRMGCSFCETARMGLLANLTPAQIVRQLLVARRLLPPVAPDSTPDARSRGYKYHQGGIQNVVFMGMGEPLDNFDNLVQAVRVLNEPAGLDFPHAQITVSTVGRIDGLRKLAALNWPNLRIAISLNATHDRLRDELMPINRGMPLAELQRTLLDYPMARKGRFLVEYVLIKDLNDSAADADAVADWCRPLPCIVNVIPYNPQHYASYETPSEETIGQFIFRLKDHGIFVKRRITHGRDLMGACGQLGNPHIQRTPLGLP